MTRTRPLYGVLALLAWAALFVLGAFVLALGYVIFGALIVFASLFSGVLIAIAGEEPVDAPAAAREAAGPAPVREAGGRPLVRSGG